MSENSTTSLDWGYVTYKEFKDGNNYEYGVCIFADSVDSLYLTKEDLPDMLLLIEEDEKS